jgi:hypothetical protein
MTAYDDFEPPTETSWVLDTVFMLAMLVLAVVWGEVIWAVWFR